MEQGTEEEQREYLVGCKQLQNNRAQEQTNLNYEAVEENKKQRGTIK